MTTAEEYIPDPAAHLTGFEDWKGKQLGPFSTGIRAIWLAVSTAHDHTYFQSAALIWLRLELQEQFELARTANIGADAETLWLHAKTGLHRITSGARGIENARAKVFTFLDAMTSAETDACLALAAKTLGETIESAPEDKPRDLESEGLDMGESRGAGSPVTRSQSTSRRGKRNGKGKR